MCDVLKWPPCRREGHSDWVWLKCENVVRSSWIVCGLVVHKRVAILSGMTVHNVFFRWWKHEATGLWFRLRDARILQGRHFGKKCSKWHTFQFLSGLSERQGQWRRVYMCVKTPLETHPVYSYTLPSTVQSFRVMNSEDSEEPWLWDPILI